MARTSFVTHVALSVPLMCWATASSSVQAQELSIATDELTQKVISSKEGAEDGWKAQAKVGATFSLNHNDNVVGTENGLTLLLGAILSGSANLHAGQHLWENSLSIQETFTRTPQLRTFVKSLDQVDLVSTYAYSFKKLQWLGLFGRLLVNTQLLDGELVATETIDVNRINTNSTLAAGDITRADTTPVTQIGEGERFNLTGPFEPLNLRQSLGAFAQPVTSTTVNITTKIGVGAQEIITRGGDIVVTTLENDTLVVVRELEDFVFELGAELEIDVRGLLVDEVLSYYLTLNAFYPPVTTSDVNRDFGDSINMRFKAGASIKLSKIASIDYVLTILRIPSVTTDFQVQNGLLVSASFDLL